MNDPENSFGCTEMNSAATIRQERNSRHLLLAEGALRIFINGILTIVLARNLGVSAFGTFAFLVASNMFFLTFTRFGLDSLIVSRLQSLPLSRGSLLFTTIHLRATLIALSLPIYLFFMSPYLTIEMLSLVAIISVLSIGSHLESIYFVDNSLRTLAAIRFFALSVFTCAKLLALYYGFGVNAFFLLHISEAAVLGTLFILTNASVLSAMNRIYLHRLQGVLYASWPLALSGIAVIAYTRMDQVMLGAFGDTVSLGQYAVASRLTEMTLFVAAIFANTSIQTFQKKRAEDADPFVRSQYRFFFWMGALFGFFSVLGAWFLEEYILGTEYNDLTMYVALLCLSLPFSFLGIMSGRFFVNEKATAHILSRTLGGLLVNFFLNLVLIPSAGAVGCAIATLASQIFSNLLFDLSKYQTRRHFSLKLGGIFCRGRS